MLARTAGLLAAGAVMVLLPLGAGAQTTDRGTLPRLTEVSRDTCASPLSYHASEVEPMTAAHGQMLVSTFQVGRVYDGGSCDIGWSTSMDGGRTWQTGLLPLTIFGGQATTGAGPLTRASHPALAYAHTAGALVTKNNVASNLAQDPNDIAMSVMPAPTDGNPAPSFGAPVRIPIEADSGGQSNTNDHFIPGIAADPNTSGSSAHLGLFYYSYRVAGCQPYNYDNLCAARVGYDSSRDAGAHSTGSTYLASMTLAEIARTSQGPMVGDYATADVISAGPCRGRAIASLAVGLAPQFDDNALAERMFAPTCGLRIGSDTPVLPVTKPPGGRAPVPRPSPHRTAH